MKSILDKSFRYTSSAGTDLKKTFARIRRERARHAEAEAAREAETVRKVAPISRHKP
jgi:septal ring factor EnvC (AmiA/AmiB activator)